MRTGSGTGKEKGWAKGRKSKLILVFLYIFEAQSKENAEACF